jgi:hypothetical protein
MENIYTSNIKAIYSGDSVKWTVRFSDYKPSDGFNLTLALRHPKNEKINLLALSDAGDDEFIFNLTNIETSTWKDGIYTAFLLISRSSDEFSKQIEIPRLEIKPNIMSLDNIDVRTHNEKVLDSIKELIEKKVLDDAYNYTINGRMLTKYKHQELIKLKNQYENEVLKEQRIKELKETGKTNKNKIYVNFKSSLNN